MSNDYADFKNQFRPPRGTASGDVQNSTIRYYLTEYSRSINDNRPLSKDDIIESLEFFDWRCPYSNKEIKKDGSNRSEFELDHIIPINREQCGLNIKGNVVFVSKDANRAKAGRDWKEFLQNYEDLGSEEERKDRIDKIIDFQKKTGYSKYLEESFVKEMREKLKELYSKAGKEIADNSSKLKNIKPSC